MRAEMKFTPNEISCRHEIFSVYMEFHFGLNSELFHFGGGRNIGPTVVVVEVRKQNCFDDSYAKIFRYVRYRDNQMCVLAGCSFQKGVLMKTSPFCSTREY